MSLKIYQIDAFASGPFTGNPAAVVPLTQWLDDAKMQAIAEENNLAETAFFIPCSQGFHIRWFTPSTEVKLCGHATLASAYVLFNILGYDKTNIAFESLSGILNVSKGDNGLLVLDFPLQKPTSAAIEDALVRGLGRTPEACLHGEDIIAVYSDQTQVAEIIPKHSDLRQLSLRAVIATAPGTDSDFVTRVFAPKFGIPEDPVTGSAYTQLMPYWAERLGKNQLKAKQISARGGEIFCELKGDRVMISGYAHYYMEGNIFI